MIWFQFLRHLVEWIFHSIWWVGSLHLQISWSFFSLFSGLWQPEKYTNDLLAEPWEWTTHTRAFFCSSEVVVSVCFVFRDAMFSVYSNLHYPIISRQTKKHRIQINLFWNVQYSILNHENSRTMKVCNNSSMSLRVKTRILLFLDFGGRELKSSTVTARHVTASQN